MIKHMLSFLLLALVALGLYSNPAHASCTHTIVAADLPYTITTGGTYCLGGDVYYSPNAAGAIAITVNAGSPINATSGNSSHVIIDMAGWTLYCLGGYCGSSYGVYLQSGGDLTTIKGGGIYGFQIGAYIDFAPQYLGPTVQDMNISGATTAAVYLSGNSSRAVVKHCNLGGYYGVQVWSASFWHIHDNTFYGSGAGLRVGASSNNSGIAQGNRFHSGGYAIDCYTGGCISVVYKDNTSFQSSGSRYNGSMTNGGNNY